MDCTNCGEEESRQTIQAYADEVWQGKHGRGKVRLVYQDQTPPRLARLVEWKGNPLEGRRTNSVSNFNIWGKGAEMSANFQRPCFMEVSWEVYRPSLEELREVFSLDVKSWGQIFRGSDLALFPPDFVFPFETGDTFHIEPREQETDKRWHSPIGVILASGRIGVVNSQDDDDGCYETIRGALSSLPRTGAFDPMNLVPLTQEEISFLKGKGYEVDED